MKPKKKIVKQRKSNVKIFDKEVVELFLSLDVEDYKGKKYQELYKYNRLYWFYYHYSGGLDIKGSCKLARFEDTNIFEWKNKESKKYKGIDFVNSIKKAECSLENYHLQLINKHAKKTWYASAWVLERRYPKKYKNQIKHEFENSPFASGVILNETVVKSA